MFNNASHVDVSHSTFSEVHGDQYYTSRATEVHGNQTINTNTIVQGNQILQQDSSQSNRIEALRKANAPSAAYDSALRYPAPKCIEGTRIELLARITSWADEPDRKPICWLNGRPGSGKSAVSQTIAEDYAHQQRLAASFFFSRRDLERRTTQHVVPTLTMQLLTSLPSIQPAVVAALESDYMIPMKVLREQMEKLLFGPLSTATETPDRPLLIVVDALDECDDESLVSELVTLLALLPSKTLLPLRLVITSRSEPWLQSQFHRPDLSALTLPLDIHTFSAEADIRSFLYRSLNETYDQHPLVMQDVPRPWPAPNELERIVSKAGGLFIFALTVIKFVGDRMHNPIERLQAILEDRVDMSAGAAYAELDSLYRDAISIVPDPDVVRLVLGVVYCMVVPLSVSGLHKLLQQPDVDARVIIPALSSVLLASEDGKQPIQFYHASFRDFLINRQRSQRYAIEPDVYHRFMAQLCFETMSNGLKRDMCRIGDPSKANNEVSDLAERRQAAFDEALSYACRFWSRHLAQLSKHGLINEGLLGALRRFSTTVLLCWIESLSIFGELESAVMMLREGISWMKTLREVPGEALALFEDAERLVVLYMECISQCPLHVYLTAMAFVSTDTAIYKTYKHQLFGKVILHQDREGWLSLRTAIDLHSPIHSVVFSPNGDLIATAGALQGVQMWDTITSRNVASLGDRSSTSLLVRFSPSGTFLAAAFEGGTVAVWDPKVGRELLKDEGCHTEPIICMEFSANSALLASGSRDRAIQVWSMETKARLYRLPTHEGPVTTLAFSGDSLQLFSGAGDNLIIVWDMSSGKLVHGMMGHQKPVNCIAVSHYGNIIASGSEDKTIKLWDTSSGKCTQTFSKGHYTGIRNVHFFDEDKHLITACDEAILSRDLTSRNTSDVIWAADQYLKSTLKRVPRWHNKMLGVAAPMPLIRYIIHQSITDDQDPQHVAVAYATQTSSFVFVSHLARLFAGTLPNPVRGLPLNRSGPATSVAISSDGSWAVTGDSRGSLRILDLATPAITWDFLETAVKSSPLSAADLVVPSPKGTRFIIRNMLQWNLADVNYHLVKKIDIGMMGSLHSNEKDIRFKFSADESVFYGVIPSLLNDDKSMMRIYDSLTGEQRAQFQGLKKVDSFIATADGAWTACGHGAGKVDVFKVAGKERTSIAEPDSSPVHALVFSDDAQQLVGGAKSGVVHIWDRASGECKATFGVSTSVVTALAYDVGSTNGGARVAIGREEGSVCLWFPSTSTSRDVLRADQATVKNVDVVRFTEDGRLMSRGENGSVSYWALPSDTEEGADSGAAVSDTTTTPAPTGLPHLISQSDPEDAVDSLFHTAYRVRKDGWLVDGERRVIWMQPSMRPRGRNTFYAYANGQAVFFTPSVTLVFLRWVDE